MPQPYPGQDWKHGWIPLNSGAARSKNHGRKPGSGSLISRVVAEAAEIHKRQQAQDAERKSRQADTAKPSPAKPAAKAPTRQGAKPKAGKKVGADSRNAPLREGDQVNITEGSHKGKTGTIAGKGQHGAIKVDIDGQQLDVSPANLRSQADRETSRQADAAIRRAAGRRPAAEQPPQGGSVPIGKIQDQVRDAYRDLASQAGSWVSLTRIRQKLAADLPRDRVDEALRLLERRPDVNIVPESNQKTLTSADRRASVRIGGQDKHLITFLDQR
jgi:hypothetical protein